MPLLFEQIQIQVECKMCPVISPITGILHCSPPGNPFRDGVTLLEIMAAMMILAFAFIPIVGVIGTGATDTDVTNSYIFAQTAARTILENLLDNVPFECVHLEPGSVSDLDGTNSEDHVSSFKDSGTFKVASFVALLGNTADLLGRGTLVDGRGTNYSVKLLVFPIEGVGSDTPDPDTEVTFNYLPRPDFENASASDKSTWYTGDEYVPAGNLRPYDYAVSSVKVNARGLGVSPGTNASEMYCLMKRFLLRIRWKTPPTRERFLEIFTAKANLSKKDD